MNVVSRYAHTLLGSRGSASPLSCGPTPNSEAKLRRNLDEIYNSTDAVLMNHAFEAGDGVVPPCL